MRRRSNEAEVPTPAEVTALAIVTNAGLRRTHGMRFPMQVAPWRGSIEKVMRIRQTSAADACVVCCERLQRLGHLNPAARNWLVAATAEFR